MPIEFQIDQRLAGFTATSARKDESVSVLYHELIGPQYPDLALRLDGLHGCLFSKIPGLPLPPRIGDPIVVIDHDLAGKAYVDELPLITRAIAARPVKKGEAIFQKDISGIESVDLGVSVSDDAAIVVIRSSYWKRSLFYDFGPLHEDAGRRTYDIDKALGQQMTLLLGLPAPSAQIAAGPARTETMKQALDRLADLLADQCDDEATYQELLTAAPWMLGASYSALVRHQKMDDANIPDFTALRAYDECHDVVELKQPFLRLFRSDGSLSATFNDAWNQAERYLDFCQRQRTYLMDQKQLRFENSRCILLIGHDLTIPQSDAIRSKESMSRLITVMTYDQLYRHARHFFDVVVAAEDRTYPSEQIGG